jgi:hypothetical protein
MTEQSPSNPDHPQRESASINAQELLQLLRRKEHNWVEWGQACQQLQKAGYNPNTIFEETGFEPIQQNQVIVASQVYATMLKAGISQKVRARFERTGSDTLYELRILTQAERAAAAEFIVARNLDSEAAREVAKAVKDFSRRSTPPEGFTNHPGDAVAYEYWKLARQQNNLQDRSRLIARGLMYADSQEARQQIEKLLTEFSSSPSRKAPRLPLYRLEVEEALPRLLPVVGQLPLTTAEFHAIPTAEATGSFQLVEVSQKQTLMAIPGWQVISKAQDPVAILCSTTQLPTKMGDKPEDVLLVVDRAEKKWEADSYFVVDNSGQLEVQWFPDSPNLPLLGRLILVLRPKKILDESASQDVWQIDE